MKDYWELSEKERSALTEEEVSLFVSVELMKEGLTAPEEPEYLTVKPVAAETITLWHLKYVGDYGKTETSVGFPTKEAAERAIELGAVFVDSAYQLGRSIAKRTVGVVPRDEAISEADAERLRDALVAEKTAESTNESLLRRYREECSKCEKATSAMWNDWHECRAKAREVERVSATFEEYKKLAGDEWTATKFLRKAFDSDELKEASEWLGVEFMERAPPVAAEHL